MTAEVVVMNPLGVALAADSAVTLGTEVDRKVYPSAEKLFQLSNACPIGVLIYGNSNFVSVPWETIIKTYRAERRLACFGTVREYGEDFLTFLRTNRRLLPLTNQRQEILKLALAYFQETVDIVYENIRRVTKGGAKKLSEADIRNLVQRVVDTVAKIVDEHKPIAGLPRNARDRIRRICGRDIDKLKKSAFQNLPISPAASRKLSSSALGLLVRNQFGPLMSGVVVAGFGTREYMPALVSLRLEGMIEGRPRYDVESREAIGLNNSGFVRSFAQGEMVYTFMEGIDPRLQQLIEESTRQVFAGTVETILNEVRQGNPRLAKKVFGKLSPHLASLLDDLLKQWQARRRRSHWGPVMDVVSALPKDELAAMAEAMVNLTKFKRRVSAGIETVGGPIDVAVVTKGDGFVWVKRKHYFDPSLNPRVLARFSKEISHG